MDVFGLRRRLISAPILRAFRHAMPTMSQTEREALEAGTVFESCGTDRFHKDGRRVYMQTNKGDVDLIRLVLFDPETGNLMI